MLTPYAYSVGYYWFKSPALTSLGVLPVITLAAVVGISAMLYRRFRR